ncbi:hypothetical protein DAPPUDRAFT_256497 [Daphnia pulex]|uniref:Tyr recombinase domain-containing protein n=1 Tax=Daphnia pulex TaxID=6669 RepID=E9HBH6_DAPPU|nr:hypothetical protein DAPPUDRAFT_256497 [Daphnia pulex]|eukprot:EFX70844.1 hypothetical protein DAPPUDRAFT_256497 [Daphnia pulex]
MKGIFNSNPPKPKYSGTWDVDLVIHFFKSTPPNKELSLIQLSLKTAMLLALVTMFRVSELAAIDSASQEVAKSRTSSLSYYNPSTRRQNMPGYNDGRLLESDTCFNVIQAEYTVPSISL